MVIFLITSVLFLGLVAIGIYFWQKPSTTQDISLPPATLPRGLFSETKPVAQEPLPENNGHEELLSRAREGELKALSDAKGLDIYSDVLDSLVAQAQTEPKLLSLASYVKQNKLPGNKALADAMFSSWQATPNRQSTPKMLHFAALTDNAEVYRNAVATTMTYWRNGRLKDISGTELLALLNGEFWVLSSRVRNSGNGFILKRTLSSARRELEGTTNN